MGILKQNKTNNQKQNKQVNGKTLILNIFSTQIQGELLG